MNAIFLFGLMKSLLPCEEDFQQGHPANRAQVLYEALMVM